MYTRCFTFYIFIWQFLDENGRLKSENQSLKKDLLCAIDGQRSKDSSPKDRKGKHALMIQDIVWNELWL